MTKSTEPGIPAQVRPTPVLRQPSLRQLRGFTEVARHASFSRAAEALSLSQPALSSAIRELETLMGVTLFDRSTHHVRLTDAGQAVQAQIEWMLNSFSHGAQDLRHLIDTLATTVRIGCIPSTMHLLAPAVAQWQRANPTIKVRLGDYLNDELATALRNGDLDLGLGLDYDLPDEIESIFVAEDELVAVVPSAHPLATRSAITWKDLADEPLAVLSRGSTYDMITAALNQQGISLALLDTLRFTDTLYSLVRNGLRVGLISRLYTLGQRIEGMTILPLVKPELTRRIALLARAPSDLRRTAVQSCLHGLAQALHVAP